MRESERTVHKRRSPDRWLPWLLAAVLFAAYTVESVGRHLGGRSGGYDLGIFTQAVRGYAEGRAPVAELKGPGYNLLGDHFHPLLAVLTPAYRLFPTPVTLLVAQALLLAWSAVPVTRLGIHILGTRSGLCVGVGYGLSWGLQRAVDFDFHEVSLAVPLLAMSAERLVRRDWCAAVAWAAPVVLVKEDLPATVAAIGGYLLLRRQWRLGLLTVAGSVLAGVLIVKYAIPALNPAHRYAYAHTDSIAKQTATKIFLPHADANQVDLEQLGVPQAGISFLRDTPPEARMFLIVRGQEMVKARFDLSGLSEFIPVLSSNDKAVALYHEIMAELGTEDPEKVVPVFMERAKLRNTHNLKGV